MTMKHAISLFAIAMWCVATASAVDYGHTPVSASQSQKWLVDTIPNHWVSDSLPMAKLPSDDPWWKSLGDPILTSLINTAEEKNFNLLAAVKRVDASRQSLLRVRSGYFPTIGLSGGWTKGQSSGRESNVVSPSSGYDYFSLGMSASWEPDLFGRVRQQAKVAGAQLNVSRADYAATMVSVCAQVARSYITLRTYQEQYEVSFDHIDMQEKLLDIAEARYQAGLVSSLDVAQARTLLYSTRATIPSLKAAIDNTLNSIATLCGEYPSGLDPNLKAHVKLPKAPAIQDLGFPADLVRRRPDIVAAEYNLEALAAQVGVAKKDFLPSLTITGDIGTSSHRLDGLFGSHSLSFSVTPMLTWTAFDGLARNYALAESKANLEAAMDTYNLTVMQAIEDVNNNLNTYAAIQEEIALEQAVVDESRHTLELAVERYKLGLTDFTSVANAQMTLLENINAFVSSRGSAMNALVNLYESLGGGF